MKDSILLQILDTMSRSVLNDLELAKAIKHPGESGRARERILTSFLTKLVGDTFGVSTGFVIDTNGAISKQIDLIIYRNDYHPRLDIGGINHFLVEAVVATIEVKAAITSSERLTEAIDNIKSVKELDRSGGGRNIVLTDRRPDVSFDPDNFSHQVFGAIVTERSLAIENVHDQLYAYLSSVDRRLWPNLYVDARSFTIGW